MTPSAIPVKYGTATIVATGSGDVCRVTFTALPDIAFDVSKADPFTSPAGNVGDVDVVFVRGSLWGLKLVGFAIWERRSENARRNVTVPQRTYHLRDGSRRSYSLLRPDDRDTERAPAALDLLRWAVLTAFEAVEGSEHRASA